MKTTVEIDSDRLAKLEEMTLWHGAHVSFEAGVCAMEAVAWLAGEPHADHPKCACPVVSAAVRRLNDRINSDALRTELLRPLLVRLVGSRSTKAVQVKRGFIAADFAVRVFAPIALRARGFTEQATQLEALEPICDKGSAEAGRKLATATYAATATATDAAATARRRVYEKGVRMIEAMLAVN